LVGVGVGVAGAGIAVGGVVGVADGWFPTATIGAGAACAEPGIASTNVVTWTIERAAIMTKNRRMI
jgi:hypothetical protein